MTASRFTWLLTLVVFAGRILPGQQNELRTVADGLAGDIAVSGKKAIAVVDFTDLNGSPTELGRFLAEEMSVAMTRTRKGLEIIDRTRLKAILNENKLAASGLIDPATAKKIGQIAGADALVTGSMTPFSESVRVTIKVIATDTARIIAADSTDIPKTQTISALIDSGVSGKDHQNEVPKTDKDPVLCRADLMIKQTYLADLDACRDTPTLQSADLWFEAVSSSEKYIVPQSGAMFALVSASGIRECKAADFRPDRISLGQLSTGTVLCVKTKQRRVGRLQVTHVPSPSEIGYLGFSYIVSP